MWVVEEEKKRRRLGDPTHPKITHSGFILGPFWVFFGEKPKSRWGSLLFGEKGLPGRSKKGKFDAKTDRKTICFVDVAFSFVLTILGQIWEVFLVVLGGFSVIFRRGGSPRPEKGRHRVRIALCGAKRGSEPAQSTRKSSRF